MVFYNYQHNKWKNGAFGLRFFVFSVFFVFYLLLREEAGYPLWSDYGGGVKNLDISAYPVGCRGNRNGKEDNPLLRWKRV